MIQYEVVLKVGMQQRRAFWSGGVDCDLGVFQNTPAEVHVAMAAGEVFPFRGYLGGWQTF